MISWLKCLVGLHDWTTVESVRFPRRDLPDRYIEIQVCQRCLEAREMAYDVRTLEALILVNVRDLPLPPDAEVRSHEYEEA